MTFDRPYDRSSTGTNAYSIAPAIAPAIGFDRPFDRVYPIPSHSYARSKRSPRPWGPTTLRSLAREGQEEVRLGMCVVTPTLAATNST